MSDQSTIRLPRTPDLANRRFGRWVVVEFAGYVKSVAAAWHCVCDCGHKRRVNAARLRNGKSQSCGECLLHLPSDMFGDYIRDRIVSAVSLDESGCWLWQHRLDKDGYGRPRVGGRSVRAHVLSYSAFIADVPSGMCVCHKCDTPRCVNPFHLFLGTNQDNLNDKLKKKRQASGEKVNTAKLTAAQVSQIRDEYPSCGLSMKSLGNRYGVSPSTVWNIVNRHSWR